MKRLLDRIASWPWLTVDLILTIGEAQDRKLRAVWVAFALVAWPAVVFLDFAVFTFTPLGEVLDHAIHFGHVAAVRARFTRHGYDLRGPQVYVRRTRDWEMRVMRVPWPVKKPWEWACQPVGHAYRGLGMRGSEATRHEAMLAVLEWVASP